MINRLTKVMMTSPGCFFTINICRLRMSAAIFPFFRLLQERGDIVYAQLWGYDTMYEIYNSGFTFLIRRVSATTDYTSLLPLSVRANKKLFTEALEQLQRDATWSSDEERSGFSTCQYHRRALSTHRKLSF
jgi:hypothetical protein